MFLSVLGKLMWIITSMMRMTELAVVTIFL
jgi:hypothetical protein